MQVMPDHLCSYCKHAHTCNVVSTGYDKTQEPIPSQKPFLYLDCQTTPAMYNRNAALSAEVICDFHEHIQDWQKTILQMLMYKYSWEEGKKSLHQEQIRS